VRVAAELGQHPGAEDRAEPGLAGVDVSVLVSSKMLFHYLTECVDLVVECSDEAHFAGGDDGERCLHCWRLA
jgi:hypothetical protein